MNLLRRPAPDWLTILFILVLTIITAVAAFDAGTRTVPVPEAPPMLAYPIPTAG